MQVAHVLGYACSTSRMLYSGTSVYRNYANKMQDQI